MSQIGRPLKHTVIEPKEEPVPAKEPVQTPAPEPVKQPA